MQVEILYHSLPFFIPQIDKRCNSALQKQELWGILLTEKGLIVQDSYRSVELTEEGRRYALKIRHRHTVIYGFLTQVPGVSPNAAEKDACLMEQDLSGETFEKLLLFLHNQEID